VNLVNGFVLKRLSLIYMAARRKVKRMIPTKKRQYHWKDREACKCGRPKARRDQRICGTCARILRDSVKE